MKKPPPLQGKLKTPIKWRGPSVRQRMVLALVDKPSEYLVQKHKLEEELGARYLLLEVLEKLPLLADRYGLKPNKDEQIPWIVLLMKVCQEYIPGFRVKNGGKTRGSPKVWTPKRFAQLRADVDNLKSKKSRSDAQACRDLVKANIQSGEGPYLPKKMKNGKQQSEATAISSLEARLTEARRFIKLDPQLKTFEPPDLVETVGYEPLQEALVKQFSTLKRHE